MHGWANLAELLHIYSSPAIHQHNKHTLLTWVLINSFFSGASNTSKELVCNREEKHVGELVINVLFLLWKEDKKKNSAHSLPSPSLPKISCQAEILPRRPGEWDFLQAFSRWHLWPGCPPLLAWQLLMLHPELCHCHGQPPFFMHHPLNCPVQPLGVAFPMAQGSPSLEMSPAVVSPTPSSLKRGVNRLTVCKRRVRSTPGSWGHVFVPFFLPCDMTIHSEYIFCHM